MLIFSFSLYGSLNKYTEGMVCNNILISKHFPKARIYIYIADDVPANIRAKLSENPNTKLIDVPRKEGISNMFDRFNSIDDPECTIMIVRDADSRIHERDIACIEDFLASDKLLHIIRDHRWHCTQILGGLWGLRKSGLNEPMGIKIKKWLARIKNFRYGVDQDFLAQTIYPLLKKDAMIHDRFRFFESPEALTPFRVPIQNNLFCGQVHLFTHDGVEYTEFDSG